MCYIIPDTLSDVHLRFCSRIPELLSMSWNAMDAGSAGTEGYVENSLNDKNKMANKTLSNEDNNNLLNCPWTTLVNCNNAHLISVN